MIPENESLRSGNQYGWVLDEGLLPGLQIAIFSLYPCIVKREKGESEVRGKEREEPESTRSCLCYKGTNVFNKVSTFMS